MAVKPTKKKSNYIGDRAFQDKNSAFPLYIVINGARE